MRYRLLATYQGAPYEAGIGPDETGVVLFAACPPPEDLRFEPATGHWRKMVNLADVQALYESRPVGMFRGERCVVLDDLTDRLHIAYLGHDAYLAERLGYWEVDRGAFELITPRQEVTEIVEQRLPITLQAGAGSQQGPGAQTPGQPAGDRRDLATGSWAGLPSLSQVPVPDGLASGPVADESPLPLEAEALRAAGLSEPSTRVPSGADTTSGVPSWAPHKTPAHGVPLPAPPGDAALAARGSASPVNGAFQAGQASGAGILAGVAVSEPHGSSHAAVAQSLLDRHRPEPTASVPAMPVASGLVAPAEAGRRAGAAAGDARPVPRRRRASRRRLPTQRIFSELAAQAAIAPGAYAINEDVDGAMCLVRTAEGFEVFNSLAGARHEVRVFGDEESAYFYLFGVLVADAVRTGALAPRP